MTDDFDKNQQLQKAAILGVFDELNLALKLQNLDHVIKCETKGSTRLQYDFGSTHGYLASIMVPIGPKYTRQCYAEIGLIKGKDGPLIRSEPLVFDQDDIKRVPDEYSLLLVLEYLRKEDTRFVKHVEYW